jgi:SAM-dependent methyltransferase
MKRKVPWWAKMASKVLLSRLPLPRTVWRFLGVFEHGDMLNPEYSLDVFSSHYNKAACYLPEHFTVLELGSGDSVATAVIAHAYGASKTYLVDVEAFASYNIKPYWKVCRLLETRGLSCRVIESCRSVPELLDTVGATYFVDGLDSLRTIPKNSVDFTFSHAVLEHIAESEFGPTIQALYEVLSPGGVSSHRIDLKDHLGNSLHSLRFSRRFWESKFIGSSGFYTNRLRCSQIITAFEATGFEILGSDVECWQTLPLPRHRLHSDFAQLSDDDLLVRGLTLFARKPKCG